MLKPIATPAVCKIAVPKKTPKAQTSDRQAAETSYKKAKFTASGSKRKQTHRVAENRRSQARRDAK